MSFLIFYVCGVKFCRNLTAKLRYINYYIYIHIYVAKINKQDKMVTLQTVFSCLFIQSGCSETSSKANI